MSRSGALYQRYNWREYLHAVSTTIEVINNKLNVMYTIEREREAAIMSVETKQNNETDGKYKKK